MIFLRAKKKLKKHSRKVAVKNYNKFEFPKVFGLKDTVNLLSTYRHEIFDNIFSWQAEKNILLSTYWHKKYDDFHKIWDPVFDPGGIYNHNYKTRAFPTVWFNFYFCEFFLWSKWSSRSLVSVWWDISKTSSTFLTERSRSSLS